MANNLKMAIVLYGDHGGELDRHKFEVRPEQDESAVIGNSVISAIEVKRWTLAPGDMIRIVQEG